VATPCRLCFSRLYAVRLTEIPDQVRDDEIVLIRKGTDLSDRSVPLFVGART